MVITASAPNSASAGVPAAIEPSWISGLARPSLRFHTDNSCPAASSRRAIGVPMLPVPKKPIFIEFLPRGLVDLPRSAWARWLVFYAGPIQRVPAQADFHSYGWVEGTCKT